MKSQITMLSKVKCFFRFFPILFSIGLLTEVSPLGKMPIIQISRLINHHQLAHKKASVEFNRRFFLQLNEIFYFSATSFFVKKRSSDRDNKNASKSTFSCSVRPNGFANNESRFTEFEINLSGVL